MASIGRSIAYSFGEKYYTFVVQFASSIIIARLLSPKEIGIFSIASVFVALSNAIRDLGISNYVVQERQLSPAHLQTAQTMMVAASWTFAALLWFAAPAVASFYAEPGVGLVMNVLAFNFALIPFGALSLALLRRGMKFGRLFAINATATTVHAVVAVTMSYLGHGFMSLAWAALASTFVTVVGALLAREGAVSLRPAIPEWRRVLTVGGRFSLASVLWELGLGSPDLIVGKTMSMEQTGLLGRAFGVVNLVYRTIMEALAPVMMPYFARNDRAGNDVGEQGVMVLHYVSGITFPVFACLAVSMDVVVLLLYGSQWGPSADPARFICFGMAFLTLMVVAGAALGGTGGSRQILQFQLAGQPAKIFLVLLASSYTIRHVAAAIAIGDCLVALYAVWLFRSRAGIPVKRVLVALVPSVGAALIAVAACVGFRMAVSGTSPLIEVTGCIVSSALGWLLGLAITRHQLGGLLLMRTREFLGLR
jgi:O-antigen/teichoic acid export membrane protein